MAPLETFCIPDFESILSVFPYMGNNPYYESTYPESRAWIAQYWKGIYGPKMEAFMDRCRFELLTSYVYPYASKERLRAFMDVVSGSFLFTVYFFVGC